MGVERHGLWYLPLFPYGRGGGGDFHKIKLKKKKKHLQTSLSRVELCSMEMSQRHNHKQVYTPKKIYGRR